MACPKRGFAPGRSSQLKFPLVARMSWRGLYPFWPSPMGKVPKVDTLKNLQPVSWYPDMDLLVEELRVAA